MGGCSDDVLDSYPAREYADGSIALRIGAESRVRTKTVLAGSYNRHHVRQAYAILYKGMGDDATYLCHKDLNWSPKDSADYAEGVVQQKVFKFDVPPSLQSGTVCTLLCVGLDDNSGTTYGLTLNDDQTPSFCADGKTLTDAKAILADGQSMLTSELFAGWDTLTYQRKETNSVEVEMTRRVAGAYAYLKDIPAKVSGKDVKYIQWTLGNNPTTQIGLARVERTADNTLPDDFGSGENTTADAKVLDKLTLTDIATANTTTNLYEIDTLYTKTLGLTKGTLLLSAYLLPMKAATNGTLAVELLDAEGNTLKSFPAQWNNLPAAAGTKTNYSVYPNYVYHAGTRSVDSDRPASLAGDRIELVVQPWTELTINTDFPKVPLEATIDYDKNPSSYIYDCINTTDKITIMPSLLQRGWKLTLVAEDKDGNEDLTGACNWIYFVKSDGSYTQTLSSSDYTDGTSTAVDITIRLCDYMNPHYSEADSKNYKYDSAYDPSTETGRANINSDWRRARIVVTTEDSSSPSHISIRQYNAITVIGKYDKNTRFSCGVSRYDYGVVRDANGNIITQGYAAFWGFKDKSYNSLHNNYGDANYYDGHFEYISIKNEWGGNSTWWGTDDVTTQPAIRYAMAESWVYEDGQRKQDLLFWYLASRSELSAFFSDMAIRQPAIETHVEVGALYWSSTPKFNSNENKAGYKRSFCQKLTSEGNLWVNPSGEDLVDTREFRNNNGYARRARHFNGYTCTIKIK